MIWFTWRIELLFNRRDQANHYLVLCQQGTIQSNFTDPTFIPRDNGHAKT